MTHPTFNQVCEDIRHFANLDSKTIIGYTTILESELGISDDTAYELLVGIRDKYNITFMRDDFGLYPDQFLFRSFWSRIVEGLHAFSEFPFGEKVKAVSAGDLFSAICKAIDRKE